MSNKLHFRVDTPALIKEIADNALSMGKMGIFKVPLNTFMSLLSDVAQRATELNDPIMNKCMFDLNLYELPSPSTKEYSKLMDKVYKAAEKQKQLEQTKK